MSKINEWLNKPVNTFFLLVLLYLILMFYTGCTQFIGDTVIPDLVNLIKAD